MIAEQERTESKRRQAQGIKIAKANGVYKGRPKLYSADTKDPQRRLVYKSGSIIYGTDESELILQPHFHFRY